MGMVGTSDIDADGVEIWRGRAGPLPCRDEAKKRLLCDCEDILASELVDLDCSSSSTGAGEM